MTIPDNTRQRLCPRVEEPAEFELLERTRRRDREAFSRLYRLYHPRLYGYLMRFLSNPASVEEVLDDVMMVVWKDADRFQGKSSVSTWIFGIAYHKVMTAMRASRRYRAGLDRNTPVDSLAGEPKRHREWIRAGLMHLSPDHRQVVELTYFGGFSYKEIAEIAGCPENTVKTRMYHARRRLKILLPELAGQTRGENREQS